MHFLSLIVVGLLGYGAGWAFYGHRNPPLLVAALPLLLPVPILHLIFFAQFNGIALPCGIDGEMLCRGDMGWVITALAGPVVLAAIGLVLAAKRQTYPAAVSPLLAGHIWSYGIWRHIESNPASVIPDGWLISCGLYLCWLLGGCTVAVLRYKLQNHDMPPQTRSR